MLQKLNAARQELLDLSFRNPLLNYRLLKARGVEVVDERAAAVYEILVAKGRPMTFLPAPEKSGPAAAPIPPEDPEEPAARYFDSRLQTAHPAEQLQRRLVNTHYLARTLIEEQGANTLFLALGMLHWFESPASDNERLAPLILIPVELDRKDIISRFRLRYSEEEIGGNISLQAKLRAEFGLELPALPDEELDPAAYLAAVGQAVRRQPRWFVEPDAMALGFFSFGTFLMYNDLDPAAWPEGEGPAAHPLIQAALDGGFAGPPSPFGDGTRIDDLVTPQNSHQVVDADSSQTLVLLDANDGRSLVVQGPPGTGKSQTITNMIAEAIGAGKRVLFVAEKIAALEVVKRRLDQVNLGDACLELHSHKTTKKAFLQELKRTVQLGQPRQRLDPHLSDKLKKERDLLNAYAEAVNQPVGASGVSPLAAYGRLMQLPPLPDSPPFQLDGMATWTGDHFREVDSEVRDLQTLLQTIGRPDRHLFWGSGLELLSLQKRREIQRALQAALAAIVDLDRGISELAGPAGLAPPAPAAATPAAIRQAIGGHWRNWPRFFAAPFRAARRGLGEKLARYREGRQAVEALLEFDGVVRFGPGRGLEQLPLAEQTDLLQKWLTGLGGLADLARFNAGAARLRGWGLGELVTAAAHWDGAAGHLADLLARTWYEQLLDAAGLERPALAGFNGQIHGAHVARFQQLDRLQFEINQFELAASHWESIPRSGAGGQMGVLQREFHKKIRHLPIRRLMLEAGHAIQTIKPVFMMSPMSIATFLPPSPELQFDLVIFDEASQVRPEEAFGAMLRGRQVVVVGDNRQLPPTSFFRKMEEADDEATDFNPAGDTESVLDLLLAQGAPQRMLRWHYRSRHESLIKLSNQEFYDSQLVVFPSPDAGRERLGLVYHYLPETIYERGSSRTNPGEAAVVAEAVMEHARRSPHLTLGVAAFSQAQMQAIQDELEIRRRADPSLEPFFREDHAAGEPFFVKNLENVQGDERDVILISVGYGRSEDGRVLQNFGPLNKEGGERRLNVLITRARLRCEVFTGMGAEDIRDSERHGVMALKRFLQYAATGSAELPAATGRPADSPFEEAVGDAIRRAGYRAVHQVGSAGFSIDLAVVDPDHEGRYLLAVECDGATYHRAQSARDRDRLRQQILEGLGWTFHRIWSTDWFHHPERERGRLLEAIERARREKKSPADPGMAYQPVIERAAAPVAASDAVPYTRATRKIRTTTPLAEVPAGRLAGWVAGVVAVEGPLHVEVALRRVAALTGTARLTGRVRAALADGIEEAVRRREIGRQGDFLWPDGRFDLDVVRSREKLPAAERQLELIPPQEIRLAITRVVDGALGIRREEIPAAAGALLGFRRISRPLAADFDRRIEGMVREKVLLVRGEYLVNRKGS